MYGFSVRSSLDNSNYVISSDTVHCFYLGKYTPTSSQPTETGWVSCSDGATIFQQPSGSYRHRYKNIPAYNGRMPLVFVELGLSPFYVEGYNYNPDTDPSFIFFDLFTSSPTGPTVYVFISKEGEVATSTHGLYLFNQSGSLVYDSGWSNKPTLGIKAFITLTMTPGATATIPSGIVKPGIILTSAYYRRAYTNYRLLTFGICSLWCYDITEYNPGCSLTGTTVTITELITYFGFASDYNPFLRSDGRVLTLPIVDLAEYD